jgi:hypothetical protein
MIIKQMGRGDKHDESIIEITGREVCQSRY